MSEVNTSLAPAKAANRSMVSRSVRAAGNANGWRMRIDSGTAASIRAARLSRLRAASITVRSWSRSPRWR